MRAIVYYCDWDKKTESHELLRLAISRYIGQEINKITVCRRADTDRSYPEEYLRRKGASEAAEREGQGKPYVKEMPEIHFSISHSGDVWACAVSDAEVGLDLQICHKGDGEKLARRFFHPSEIRWLEQHGFDAFSRLWAYKESYVKYTGAGLKDGLDYFSVVDELPVMQREIPFRDGFWMVLTGSSDAVCDSSLYCLEYKGKL
ncbi:MAG: 4'-phosphopantetheinyl transferase superfamily protein [Lachnospiraceae bacterium]|nr:4'-phosphopantetheinyl transferase superfamily protein [Lachnospiraceae bacterium]